MKKHLLLSVLAGAALLAGCGKNEQTAANPAPSASAVASFELTANDSMKYNLTRLEVKAGQDVKVTLTNTGSMPKNVMGHNWVLLKKGVDPQAFTTAAAASPTTDYIPAALADQIIVHTKLLGAKQSDEVTFKAPTEPGEYPFVCTYPAHFLTGMKGVLVVQ